MEISGKPISSPAGYLTGSVMAMMGNDGLAKPIMSCKPLPVDVVGGSRLVPIPFTAIDRIELTGAATSSLNGNFPHNDDGSQTGLVLTIPASATFANAVQLRRVINGNVIGIRLERSYNNGAVPFGVIVDGQPIEVDWSQQLYPESQSGQTTNNAYRNILFGHYFGEGAHDVRINIPCDAAAQRVISFFGWLGDEAAGYRAPVRGVSLQDTQFTVTTASTWSFGSTGAGRGLVGFYWRNVNAGAQTLKVRAQTSGFTGELQTIYATAAGTAGSDGYFALPGIVPDGLIITASLANAFIITPVGAN